MKHSKISLLGFMGAGKSSVAPLLAQQLGMQVLDLDSIMLKSSGLTSIPEIFRTLGEPAFRDLETSTVVSVRDAQNVVISTGGGVIGRPENIEALKAHKGICVLLHAEFAQLMQRIPNCGERPLLQDPVRAEALYHQRQPLYRSYADFIVDTDSKTIEQVCSEVVLRLN
jgi:shikimate kinase